MGRDGRQRERRPRGAVLRPLALLLAAAISGFGMWRALTRDDPPPQPTSEQLSREDPSALDHLLSRSH